MITKVFESSSDWFNGEAVVQPLTKVASDLTKEAGYCYEEHIKDIKSEEGRTKLLVLALGAGEFFGTNRNGDYFPEQSLKDYHPTFVQFGNVHRNHDNKPTSKKYGTVEKSFYNEKMHRVELIVSIDNRECADIIQKLNYNEDIAVSMAAHLPYDECSICGHIRRKKGEECTHTKNELTKVLQDGRQVYYINWKPRFFDISFVFRPADRVAYVMKKVASDNTREYVPVDTIIDNTNTFDISKTALDKLSFVKKLAVLEKRIQGIVAKKIEDKDVPSTNTLKMATPSESIPENILESLSKLPVATALGSLTEKGIVAKPDEFIRIIIRKKPKDDLMQSIVPLLKNIFSKLSNLQPGIFSSLYPKDDFDFDSVTKHSLLSRGLGSLMRERSIFTEPTVRRIRITILSKKLDDKPEEKSNELSLDEGEELTLPDNSGFGGTMLKQSGDQYASTLAAMYGMYKAASLEYILNKENSKVELISLPVGISILENYL